MAEILSGIPLSLHNVCKRFGAKSVLHGINLDIQAGEFVAVVGKSGSGKSTMLRLISGLDAPDAGEVHVDDSLLRGRNVRARMMFQDARLLPWRKVLENIAIGLDDDWHKAASDALAHVGLADRSREWPTVLSGGERQRVALARALVTRPPLLLLDEPLGALDALTRIEMQRLIERLWSEEGFTAVLITHDVEEAVALSDRVVVLAEGRIALDVPIDLPRPRARASAQFAMLKETILARVMEDTTVQHFQLKHVF
jgi:sulfonate transport system ATP-binding protein